MTLSIQVSVRRSGSRSIRLKDEIVVQHDGEELRFFLHRHPGDAMNRVRLGFNGPLSFRVLRASLLEPERDGHHRALKERDTR